MNKIVRHEWDYLMSQFGENALGFYYTDYTEAIRNTYDEITGGKTKMIRQGLIRGIILTDPLVVQHFSGEAQIFNYVDQAVVFKVSASDLYKIGVIDANNNYDYADVESTGIVEGILNHKFLMWKGDWYKITGVRKALVYQGETSAIYFTTTKDIDTMEWYGQSELVIEDGVPAVTFPVYLDGVIYGNYEENAVVTLTHGEREGYIFNGYTSIDVNISGDTFIMPPKQVTITTSWTKIETTTHTVTVDGIVIGAYESGEYVSLDTPTKEGYKFQGWESTPYVEIYANSFEMPSQDIVIVSLWEAEKYTITVSNSGSGTKGNFTVAYDDTLELNSGDYAGHTFNGWSFTGTGTLSDAASPVCVLTPKSKGTVICAWTLNSHTVYYDDFTVKSASSKEVNYGVVHSFSADSITGKDFVKYNVVSGGVTLTSASTQRNNSFTMPDNDVHLSAEYKDATFTATFKVDGVTVSTQEVTYGGSVSSVPENPVKEYYTFNGWTKNGTIIDPLTDVLYADVTYIADFTRNTHTVTWNTNGGNTIEPITVNEGDTIGELPVPLKTGVTFINWTVEGVAIDSTYIVLKDVTAEAVWKDESLTGEGAYIDTSHTIELNCLNVESVKYFLYSYNRPPVFTAENSKNISDGGWYKFTMFLPTWGTDMTQAPTDGYSQWVKFNDCKKRVTKYTKQDDLAPENLYVVEWDDGGNGGGLRKTRLVTYSKYLFCPDYYNSEADARDKTKRIQGQYGAFAFMYERDYVGHEIYPANANYGYSTTYWWCIMSLAEKPDFVDDTNYKTSAFGCYRVKPVNDADGNFTGYYRYEWGFVPITKSYLTGNSGYDTGFNGTYTYEIDPNGIVTSN